MGRIPPSEFKDGDALEPQHINYILSFIRRWSAFDVAAPLSLDNSGDSPPHLSLFDDDSLIPILTPSGGMTAGSYSSPSSGTAILLIESSSTGGPDFVDSGSTATVYNCYATIIGASKFAWAKWRGPSLYLVVGDC